MNTKTAWKTVTTMMRISRKGVRTTTYDETTSPAVTACASQINKSSRPEMREDHAVVFMAMVERSLDLQKWDFRLSYKSLATPAPLTVIYDSEWCRVRFSFAPQWTPSQDELIIDYGRLHAPHEQMFMPWQNGRSCRSWHTLAPAVAFLQQRSGIYDQQQNLLETFEQSEILDRLYEEYPPKAQLALHAAVWQHYGQPFFELFDLRRPDIWEEYRKFLKAYYKHLGMDASDGSPMDNVC